MTKRLTHEQQEKEKVLVKIRTRRGGKHHIHTCKLSPAYITKYHITERWQIIKSRQAIGGHFQFLEIRLVKRGEKV